MDKTHFSCSISMKNSKHLLNICLGVVRARPVMGMGVKLHSFKINKIYKDCPWKYLVYHISNRMP